MSRLVYMILLAVISLSSSVQSQKIQGTVWDQEKDKPLTFASITFAMSDRVALTNRDGVFKVDIDNKDLSDTLIIGKPGFQYKYLPVTEIISLPSILIECPVAEVNYFDKMPLKTKGYKGGKIWEEVLDNLKKNYGKDDHTVKGYYSKQVSLLDSSLIAYSEGEIITVKKGYKNNPKSSFYQSLIDKEKVHIMNGFYEEIPITLKDPEGQKYLFPFIPEGYQIGTFDLMKNRDGPFNTTKIKAVYDLKLIGESTFRGKEVFILSFDYKAPFAMDNGTLYINKEDHALLAVTYELSDFQLTRYNSRQGYLRLVKSAQSFEYKKINGFYSVVGAYISSYYSHIKTNDMVVANTLLVSDGKRIKSDKNHLNLIKENTAPLEDYIDKYHTQQWIDQLPFIRTSDIESALNKKIESNLPAGLEVQYSDMSLSEIADRSMAQNRPIFLNLYYPSSEYTNKIESTILTDAGIVETINDRFVSARINIESNDFIESILKLQEPINAQGIITDGYGNIYYQLNSEIKINQLSRDLNRLADSLDLNRIQRILNDEILDRKEKEALAGKEIYMRLKDVDNSQKLKFAKDYLGKKKTWKEQEKMDFIFNYLLEEKTEYFHNFYLDNLKEFKKRFSAEEVEEKLIIVGMKEFAYSGYDSGYLNEFFHGFFPEKGDSLIKEIELFRISNMTGNPNEKSRSIMRHYARNGIDDWEYDRQVILDAILATDDKYVLLGFLELLNVDWFEETPHECLDLHALIYYKTGQKEKAANMVNLIREMALKRGINYQSSLHLLRAK